MNKLAPRTIVWRSVQAGANLELICVYITIKRLKKSPHNINAVHYRNNEDKKQNHKQRQQ